MLALLVSIYCRSDHHETQSDVCFVPAAAGGEVKEDPERLRFQTELEFVQCLANPHYLNCTCVT